MAHISNVGAAIWSQLLVATQDESVAANFIEIPNMRGTPLIGNEANIVQVPQFRSAAALNIAAQANLPDFEFELNFVASQIMHQALLLSAGILGGTNVRAAGDANHPNAIVVTNTGAVAATGPAAATSTVFSAGGVYTFRLTLRNSETGENSTFEFDGEVASFNTGPAVDDATTATVQLALLSVPTGPTTTT